MVVDGNVVVVDDDHDDVVDAPVIDEHSGRLAALDWLGLASIHIERNQAYYLFQHNHNWYFHQNSLHSPMRLVVPQRS